MTENGGSLTCAQRELVAQNLKLVRVHLRRRVVRMPQAARRGEAADLFQEGCLGLIRAAARYDPGRHGPFAPYALARIRSAIHAALCERFATIRVPVGTMDRRKAAARREGRDSHACPIALRVVGLPLTASRRRELAAPPDPATTGDPDVAEAVAWHLREKLRIALATACRRVAIECRRPAIRPVLEAVCNERVGIPSEAGQASLRDIGRRFGIASGRMVAWQRAIERHARAVLEADAEFRQLRSFHDTTGRAESVAELESTLAGARALAMQTLLDGADQAHRAQLVFEILTRSGSDPLGMAVEGFRSLPADQQRELLAHAQGGGPAASDAGTHRERHLYWPPSWPPMKRPPSPAHPREPRTTS